MAVIPRQVYDECENKLYQRAYLVQKASEKLEFARSRAFSVPSAMPEPMTDTLARCKGVNPNAIHGHGGSGDQVERAAISLMQAEADLCIALKWAEVFVQLDEIFDGKPEADVAEAIYRQHKQQKTVAETMHYDRQSVRRYRDSYICHCALLAAEKGLIKIWEGNDDD